MSPRGKAPKAPSQSEPTIHDVARRAQVSKSLVSMVIRGGEGVSKQSQAAVLQAVKELNYRPNIIARSLVQRRTRMIGVLLPDLRNPFFSEVISGVQGRARELAFRILFKTGERQPELEEQAIQNLLELRVDGLILAAPRVEEQIIIDAGRWTPVVVLNYQISDDSSDSLSNDNIAGAALAVEHCANLGHRRIALIEGGSGRAAQTRREGYLRAMRRFGLADYIQTAEGAHTEEGGQRGARELLRTTPLPTAIFASNDLCAIGAMDCLEEAGLKVPEDISLVGYDNTTLAALRHISLTSVNQPGSEMGRTAVDRLSERIDNGRTKPLHDVLPPSLVVRSTTASPRDESRDSE